MIIASEINRYIMTKRRKVTGVVQVYSKRARDKILEIGKNFFSDAGIDKYTDDLFSCVDELVKNAVKANYKYILIVSRLRQHLEAQNPGISTEELNAKVNELLKDRQSYDQFATDLLSKEDLSEIVRKILNEESSYINLKNKAYRESRNLSEEEKKKMDLLINLQTIREEMLKENIRVILKVEADESYLYIEVTNTAPILSKDLKRIYDKRDEYRRFRDEGREYEFFLNYIDTSDSGFGLGYATIDSFLCNMGLDPDKTLRIIAASDTTVLLNIPLDPVRERASQAS